MKINHERTLKMINTKDIVVDPTVQRDVSVRKSQFKKIMDDSNYDPDLLNPIKVALVNGRYICIDGQMTMLVQKAKNGNKDCYVQCLVYEGMTMLDIANMFVKQNGITSKVKVSDVIRVEANTGDKDAISFIRILERNHFRIDGKKEDYDSNFIKIQAVGALYDEYKLFGDDNYFDEFMHVLYKSYWDNNPNSGVSRRIITGLGLFMRTYKNKCKTDSLIRVLHQTNPDTIIRNALVDHTNGARKYAVQILLLYNKCLRTNKLPNIL